MECAEHGNGAEQDNTSAGAPDGMWGSCFGSSYEYHEPVYVRERTYADPGGYALCIVDVGKKRICAEFIQEAIGGDLFQVRTVSE